MITYPLNNIEYEAADAELFHCTRTSGIWAKNDFPFSVTGADNSITIGTGIAWINNEKFSGKVVANKETTILDLGVPDSVYPRIDIVAIQFNANTNDTNFVVKNGVPSSSPLIPAPSRSAARYELYLCKIERPAGAAVVTASNVGDLRLDPQYCGLMADSVTSVNTDQINQQIDAFIEQLRDTIDDVQSGAGVMLENYWSENGKIPVRRGGTGKETLVEDSFLVGNGENAVKLLTPSEVRHALELGGNIDSPIPVSSGGTGRKLITEDSFMRGDAQNAVKLSTPAEVLNDIGGQKKIELAHIYMDGKGPELSAGNYISFNKIVQTDTSIFSSGSNYIILKKAGLYLLSASLFLQANESQDTIMIAIMKNTGTSEEEYVSHDQHKYSLDLVHRFNFPLLPLQIDNRTEISIQVILGNGYINQYPLSHLTAIYLG